MADDEVKEAEQDIDWVVDTTSTVDYINAMTAAFGMADSALCNTKEDEKRRNRIKRKALLIVDKLVCEVYAEFFDKDDKDEDD